MRVALGGGGGTGREIFSRHILHFLLVYSGISLYEDVLSPVFNAEPG
jgi:hypothetical protein